MSLPVQTESMMGMEEISRAASIVLIETLDEQIDNMNAYWQQRDHDFHVVLRGDANFQPIVIDKPPSPQHYYVGSDPEMLKMPITEYPNLACFSYQTRPTSDSSRWDHQVIYSVTLAIEWMVASQVDVEDSYARAQRMGEAINLALMSNRSLGNLGVEIGDLTYAIVAQGSKRRQEEKGGYGPEFFMQGGRLEYGVRKESSMPMGAFYSPASAIDQT